MTQVPSRFYLYFSLFFLTGMAWLLFKTVGDTLFFSDKEICVLKMTTGIPCPSCGTTRSVMAIADGAFLQALGLNPLGFLVFGSLFILPTWLLFDLISRKQTLYRFCINAESFVQKKPIAFILILLVLLNWIWNLYKYQ